METNSSFPLDHFTKIPPAFEQLSRQFPKALLYLLIPIGLLYFSIYFKLKRQIRINSIVTFLCLFSFWVYPFVTPISCGPARAMQNFSTIGTMKSLDLYVRRSSFPIYTASTVPPSDWFLPLLYITELRYESFTPNHVRVPKHLETFSEPVQLGIHIGAFILLQSLPQEHPTVLALGILLAIYIVFTGLQQVFRYKNSPAVLGPLYMAESLGGFWSETWHNSFSSPCTSLAYTPIRYALPRYFPRLLQRLGLSPLHLPTAFYRALAILAVFTFMGAFHIYALAPVVPSTGLFRIGIFFTLNGIGTVGEAIVWGSKRHWIKSALAWVFEIALASWTAQTIGVPRGLGGIDWLGLCDA